MFAVLYVSVMGLTRCYKTTVFFTFILSHVCVMLIVLHVFQLHGNCYGKFVRARDGSYHVGRREMCRKRDIDSWMSSRRMGCSQLLSSRRRVCVVWYVTCSLRQMTSHFLFYTFNLNFSLFYFIFSFFRSCSLRYVMKCCYCFYQSWIILFKAYYHALMFNYACNCTS